MNVKVYKRATLYKEVWSESMTKVAERYKVSGSALKKTCKKLDIPVPGRGYWAKIYSGKKMLPMPLPQYDGPDEIILKDNEDGYKNSEVLSFLPEEQREKVKIFCSSIIVPDELKTPHGLIKDTIQYFKSRKESTKPSVSRVFDLNVTDSQKERAYIFLDTLFKAFEHLKYTIEIYAPKSENYINYEPRVYDNVIYIKLGKYGVPIIVRELQHRVPHVPTESEIEEKKEYSFVTIPEYDTVYTGNLTFIIDEYLSKRKSWKDSEKSKIEDNIGNIIIAIMEAINVVKLNREKCEVEEIKRREEEHKRMILEEKQENERKKINHLISNANDYCQAQKIYKYIDEIERMLCNCNDEKKVMQLKQYILWAKQKADWINPLVGREDELLGKKD